MSKNITIQEGGIGKQFTADKLRTNLVGGGTCLWVPEDEVRLTQKHITENGTYLAEDDEYYGYSKVTVNVPGGNGSADSDGKPTGDTSPGGSGSAVIGTDPTTGNDAIVGVDEDGNLVTTLIPSEIRITTPPNQTEYIDGENISLSGAVVMAYKKDGTVWTNEEYPTGSIPLNELTLEPNKADISQASGNAEATSDLDTSPLTQPIMLYGQVRHGGYGSAGDLIFLPTNGAVMACWQNNSRGMKGIFASLSPGVLGYYVASKSGETRQYNAPDDSNHSYTYNGKTVYFVRYSWSWYINESDGPFEPEIPNMGDPDTKNVAWTIVHGSVTPASLQEILVKWDQPSNGRMLETAFSIVVDEALSTPEAARISEFDKI